MKHNLFHRSVALFLALFLLVCPLPVAGSAKASAEEHSQTLIPHREKGGKAGSSADNPVLCGTFYELKTAMEDPDVRFLALGNPSERIPMDAGTGSAPAIEVNGTKNLTLRGYAEFTAEKKIGYQTPNSLFTLESGDKLTVNGSGSLIFRAVESGNALIHNLGGDVTVLDGNLRGSYNGAVFGVAILQEEGNLTIRKGSFHCENADQNASKSKYPVFITGGSTAIHGGTFSSDKVSLGCGDMYGIAIGRNATVNLYGGIFYGMLFDISHSPSNYLDPDYVMTLNGEKADPDAHRIIPSTERVEFYREISAVDLRLPSPTADRTSNEKPSFIPEGSYLHTVNWYEDGELALNTITFSTSKSYRVEIYLLAEENTRFASPLESATLNGKKAEVLTPGNKQTAIGLAMDFGKCPIPLNEVALTIDPPQEHANPDQTTICGSDTYKMALTGGIPGEAPIQWLESGDGENWTAMKPTDTFDVGCFYRVNIDVVPAEGYGFDHDIMMDPLVSATVNGYEANLFRYEDIDTKERIGIFFDFGILNDNVIEEIDVVGITEPVVDESPDYSCALTGNGYTLNTAYSNGTYVFGGIAWKDVTLDKWLRPSDRFEIGHKYTLYIDVKTESGYEFYTTVLGSSYKPAGWGYINDHSAVFGIQSDARFEQSLSVSFTCQPKTIKSVAVTGLDVPKDGFSPDFSAVTDNQYYTVDSISWHDYTGGTDMTEVDTFVGGNEYWVLITVVPKEEEGNKLCKFVDNKTTASLNGIEVKKISGDSWQEVESAPKFVRIYYTFKTALTDESRQVSGLVKSAGKESDEITLKLIPEGEEAMPYRITVKGNEANYYFAGVTDGTYTLEVTKTGHETFSCKLAVSGKDLIQNVTLTPLPSAFLTGDLDGNGKVNSADAIYLLYYTLFGETRYPVEQEVDYDKNGTVNSADAIYLLYHTLFGSTRYPLD